MRYNFFVSLLPFIEQQPIHSEISGLCRSGQSKTSYSASWYPQSDSTNQVTMSSGTVQNPFLADISAFKCPSDGNAKKSSENALGITNYFGCRGDAYVAWDSINGRGIFRVGIDIGMESVTDGTSNSAIFSESLVSEADQTDQNSKSGLALFIPATGKPSECMVYRGPNGTIQTVNGGGRKGWRWGDGPSVFCTFNTMLPPNSVSCSFYSSSSTNTNNGACIVTATSNHAGGVNIALTDAAVRFISDTIDCGLQTSPHLNTPDKGGSPFGVWGGLGTIGCGDKSL
jgi:hypothetical protein